MTRSAIRLATESIAGVEQNNIVATGGQLKGSLNATYARADDANTSFNVGFKLRESWSR